VYRHVYTASPEKKDPGYTLYNYMQSHLGTIGTHHIILYTYFWNPRARRENYFLEGLRQSTAVNRFLSLTHATHGKFMFGITDAVRVVTYII